MKKITPIIFAILAAAFYAISSPISKILLEEIPSTMLAGLLYLGAGLGMSLVNLGYSKIRHKQEYESIHKEDRLYVVLMIVLDILAPIFLLFGLSMSNPASISLINNFEIVTTTIIAFVIFKEKISLNICIGIIMITLSVILLTIQPNEMMSFSCGSLFALLACLCWGLENNCTRKLSNRNPFQVVMIKGIFSGLGSFIIALLLREQITNAWFILYALLLGFIAYGLSVFFYVIAQKSLGAAKTSAYYAISPFIGVFFSFLFYHELPNSFFYVALGIMMIGSIFITIDTLKQRKHR